MTQDNQHQAWPLTDHQIHILLTLHKQPLSIRGIARETNSHPRKTRQELQTLVEKDWVQEIPNPNNHYRIHRLTPTGQELSQRLNELADLYTQKGSESRV